MFHDLDRGRWVLPLLQLESKLLPRTELPFNTSLLQFGKLTWLGSRIFAGLFVSSCTRYEIIVWYEFTPWHMCFQEIKHSEFPIQLSSDANRSTRIVCSSSRLSMSSARAPQRSSILLLPQHQNFIPNILIMPRSNWMFHFFYNIKSCKLLSYTAKESAWWAYKVLPVFFVKRMFNDICALIQLLAITAVC